MVEYGHLHVVPGLGSFKSRLGLDRLETEDRTRGVEVARLVDETRHSYGRFLDTWPVSEDPFTYEMRVHLFARNRNFDKARRREFTGSMARYQLTVSWYENRLLETVFPTTLAHSSYVWKKDPRTRAEAAHDPDHRFSSAAGSHLITIASERAIRAVMLVLVVLGLVADAAIGRYHRAR
jgi:hypothetical protein